MMNPVPELENLRRDHKHIENVLMDSGSELPLDEIAGGRLEIRAVFEWESAEEFGLKVCCSPDGEEQTLVRFNANPMFSTVRRRTSGCSRI